MDIEFTMLNSMAGSDFIASLDQHVAWGIKVLDLKDHIFNKALIDLTDEEAKHAKYLIRERGLSVYCFSTMIFENDIELGEVQFKQNYLKQVNRIIEIAHIMQPQMIRLIAAKTSRRAAISNSMEYIHKNHPWVIPMYRNAINELYTSGYHATIENESHQCIFSNPEEILAFFEELDCKDMVSFTYDAQNLWQMGSFPTIEIYHKLAPIIGYYHVKGGQQQEGIELCWKTSLEDASWPVKEITNLVVKDRISPVICINPSHGKLKDGYNYANLHKRDLDYIRKIVETIG